MLRKLFIALALVAVAAAQCIPDEVVLDSEAGHAELRGKWVLATDGTDYRGKSFWSNNKQVTTAATTVDARFPARRLLGGNYAVYVSYSRAANRATAVPYVVRYLGGIKREIVVVDQTKAPSEFPAKWHFLGNFAFLGNSNDERIEVATDGVPTNVIVTVDAVRFERICETTTTTTPTTTTTNSLSTTTTAPGTTTTAAPTTTTTTQSVNESFDVKMCKFNCKIDSLACKRACGGRSTIPTLVCWSQCRAEHKQCQTECESQAPQPTGEATTESPRETTRATAPPTTARATTQAACPTVKQCSCKTGSVAVWRTDSQGCDYCTCQVSGVVTTARTTVRASTAAAGSVVTTTTRQVEVATTEPLATGAAGSVTCPVPTKCKCLYGEIKVWERNAAGCITGCRCRLLTTTVERIKTTMAPTTTATTTTQRAACPVAQACRCKTGTESVWYLDSRGCDYCVCELPATVRSTTTVATTTTTATPAPGTVRLTTRNTAAPATTTTEATTTTTPAPGTVRFTTRNTAAPATTTTVPTTTTPAVTCPPERECRCKPGARAVWWSDANGCRTCSCRLEDDTSGVTNAPVTTTTTTARPPTTTARCPVFDSCTCGSDAIAVTSVVDGCTVCSCRVAFQVSGLALDQIRGNTLSGVTVRFSGPFDATTQTDRNGMFDIRVPASNNDYTVTFSVPGYASKVVYVKVTGPTGVIVDLTPN